MNAAYEKFFARFKEINELPIDQWKQVHLLAWLCKRYKDYYNLDFTFSFKSTAPSKSREVYEISKLSMQLSSDPIILKDYIDWVFDKKVIERKKRITSLGYFTNTEIVNEYKFKFLFNQNKPTERTSVIPARYKEICKTHGHEIETYGELAFLSKMQGKDDLLNALKADGLDLKILEQVK